MAAATEPRHDFRPPRELDRLQGGALLAGVVGLVVALLGLLVDVGNFFQAYLVAFLFWLSIALGCFGLMMLHHLTRGAWGLAIRRSLEAATRTFPLLLVLFVPLLFGIHQLFHWSHEALVAADPILRQKHPYLNVPWFIGRAAIYFAIWMVLAGRLNRLSAEQDRTGDPALFRRMQSWSAAGFLLLVVTISFAAMDWMMSLDPHWFSSLFGLWYLSGAALSGLTFVILVAGWLSNRPPMDVVLAPRLFHDYGKLLLAFVMLWAYLSFSQLLLIWGANLPEEIPFYLRRLQGPWMAVSIILLLAHFVLPFLVLLSSGLKRRKANLVQVAAVVLAMRWLDHYWNIAPTLQALQVVELRPLAGLWMDLAALVGVGGIWLWWYFRELARRSLLPVREPFLPEIVAPSREALAHD
jgi:hypothetical protein